MANRPSIRWPFGLASESRLPDNFGQSARRHFRPDVVYTTNDSKNLNWQRKDLDGQTDEHPTVIRYRQHSPESPPKVLDADHLRRLCLDVGADDVGFVSISRPELDDHATAFRTYPWTKGLVSFVCRMNREPVRSPARSVSNLEFHHTGDRANEVALRSSPLLKSRDTRRSTRR